MSKTKHENSQTNKLIILLVTLLIRSIVAIRSSDHFCQNMLPDTTNKKELRAKVQHIYDAKKLIVEPSGLISVCLWWKTKGIEAT